MKRFLASVIGLACGIGAGSTAQAHPHVFIESNLDVVRDASGLVTELRHVWRFDELFTATVLLDFDANGDGKLDIDELDEVSSVVTKSIAEYGYYTEVRSGSEVRDFVAPERILVDYVDDQIQMLFAVKLDKPAPVAASTPFRVSVSDPTYYVAIEFVDESAIQISGGGSACKTNIERPDYDALLQEQPEVAGKLTSDPSDTLGDEWLTWLEITCEP